MTKDIVWKKNQQIHFIIWLHCIRIVTCNLDVTILVTFESKWCGAMCFNIWLFKIITVLLLLFWNNLGCSIQIFEWSYIMTHGPM